MERFITDGVLMNLVGTVALLCMVAVLVNNVRQFFRRNDRHEPITRAEYDKDETARAERLGKLERECQSLETTLGGKFDALTEGVNLLRLELARLTGHLRSSCPGGEACRTTPSPQWPVPPLPKAASSPPNSGSR